MIVPPNIFADLNDFCVYLSKLMKKHLSTVDILRGIAALLVLLYHFTGPALPKIADTSLSRYTYYGKFGVEIFFVISGFIIPYVLYKSNYSIKDFGKFISKRFVRICPPSYVVILLTGIQFFLVEKYQLSTPPWYSKITFPELIHNFTYTIPFTSYNWISGQFWTLAIEFQFYIALGLVFDFMFRGFKEFVLCSMIIIFLRYAPGTGSIGFLDNGSLFIIGGVTFLYFKRSITKVQFLPVVFLVGALCYFQLGRPQALMAVCTSFTIAFVNLNNAVGIFFGKISYSLYLTHALVGSILESSLVKFFHPDSMFTRLFCSLIAAGVAILFAYFFYSLIEVYFIDLAGKLSVKKKDKLIEQPSI